MPKLAPVTSSFLEEAKQTVEASVVIAAPVAVVWDAILDYPSWTNWFEGMKSCEATSTPESGIGSTRRVVIGPLEVDETFVTWDEHKSWGFTVSETNLILAKRMLEQVDFEDIGTSDSPATRVTYLGAFEPHWLTFLPFPLLKRQMAKAWTKSFTNLAAILETA